MNVYERVQVPNDGDGVEASEHELPYFRSRSRTLISTDTNAENVDDDCFQNR